MISDKMFWSPRAWWLKAFHHQSCGKWTFFGHGTIGEQNFLVTKPMAIENGFSFGHPKAYPKQPKNVFDLGWPYIDVIQWCIYVQMHPLCHDGHIDIMTTLDIKRGGRSRCNVGNICYKVYKID
jgi:hypothetical protein